MLLSIGVVTYERPRYLDELLTCIYESNILDNKEVELVILNNGSGSETIDLLKEWERKLTFKLLHNKSNSRGKLAYKRLFENVSGEWIITPGDDDRFRSDGLKVILQECKSADNEVSLIPFGAKTIDEQGNSTPIIFKPPHFSSKSEFLANIIFQSPFWMPATAIRRKFVDLSLIPRSITVVDWWLWLNGGLKGKIKIVPTPVIDYRIHKGQEQKSYLEDLWQLDRASSFLIDIQEGAIHEYIEKLSDKDCDYLIESFVDQYAVREVNFIEKLLLTQICRLILEGHPALASKLKDLLIVGGIDLRLASTLVESDLSTEDYSKAISIINSRSELFGTDFQIKDFESRSIGDLERELTRILSQARSIEFQKTITPFEGKILKVFRKFRFNSLIRRFIRR